MWGHEHYPPGFGSEKAVEPCMMSIVEQVPCVPQASNLKRCLVCGFIIDTTYEAERPTVRNRIGGGD